MIMESNTRIVAVLIAGILALLAASVSAESYRWKDKDGKIHYGAAVPAEYRDHPYDILDSSGRVIEHVEDTSVPLEVIAEKKIANKREPLISDQERRLQSDRLLVIRYSSEEEINNALELEIAQLGYDTKVINQSYDSTTTAIRNQVSQAADQQRAGMPISPEQQKEIDQLYARLSRDIRKRAAMTKRENRIRDRFKTELDRYIYLTSDEEEVDQEQADQG